MCRSFLYWARILSTENDTAVPVVRIVVACAIHFGLVSFCKRCVVSRGNFHLGVFYVLLIAKYSVQCYTKVFGVFSIF